MSEEDGKGANSAARWWAHDPLLSPVRSGFTLLELTIVLLLSALVMAYAGLTFGGYFHRTSAQRAALVFASDLKLARTEALRSRQSIVIRFNETNLWYTVTASSGTQLVRRSFGTDGTIGLSAINLRMRGDSIALSTRGVVDLSNAYGGVGEARFSMGSSEYVVYFNSMGASKVQQG